MNTSISTEQLKANYLHILSSLEALNRKYNRNSEDVDGFLREIQGIKVAVPIVGSFSSGKSSFVNELIGQKIVPTNITAETSIPTEISYSDTEQCYVVRSGQRVPLTRAEVLQNSFSIKNDNLIEIHLSNPFLQSIDQVKLVDIPGLDSGIEAHSQAIDSYIGKGLAYIITIDAEYGLKQSVIDLLKELNLFKMPVFVAVTKRDKKETEIEDIVKETEQKVRHLLHMSTFRIGAISTRKGEVGPLREFLVDVHRQAGDLFVLTYQSPIQSLLKQAEAYLLTRLDQDNTQIEEIEQQMEDAKSAAQQIMNAMKEEQGRFQTQLSACIQSIEHKIAASLDASADSLVVDLMNNSSIDHKITMIVRKSVIEGIQTELEPKLQKYLRRVHELIDNNFNVNSTLQLDPVKVKLDHMTKDLVTKSIPVVMAAIGFAIAGPIAALIVGVLSILVEVFFAKKAQEDKKRAAEQKLRGEIFPAVIRESSASLSSSIQQYIEEINEQLASNVKKQESMILQSLEDLKRQKSMLEEEQNQLNKELAADLEEVRKLCGLI